MKDDAPPAPAHPSWASSTASPTRCSCPTEEPRGRRGDPARRGLGEGEPLRLRARLPRRRDRRAGLRRPRPRALEGEFGPGRDRRRAGDGRAAARARAGAWRCAGRAWAASRRSTRRRATPTLVRGGGDLPGARGRSCCAACARARAAALRVRRARPRAGWLESLDLYAAAAGLGPAHRPAAAARARRRADALHRQRGAARGGARARSACCCSRAATTARCSTTWSSRRCRAASSGELSGLFPAGVGKVRTVRPKSLRKRRVATATVSSTV